MGNYEEYDSISFFGDFDKYISCPSYLLRYLEAFGIGVYVQGPYGIYSTYGFNGERLEIHSNGEYVFLCPPNCRLESYVASIAPDGGYIGLNHNYEIFCSENQLTLRNQNRDVNCTLKVQEDVLGNVSISFSEPVKIDVPGKAPSWIERNLGKVVIRVGDKKGTSRSYMDELHRQIPHYGEKTQRLINVMFRDPRILNYLTELMKKMPSDIDTSCDQKIRQIWDNTEAQKAAIKEQIANLNSQLAGLDATCTGEIESLRNYRDKCKASFGEDGIGTK